MDLLYLHTTHQDVANNTILYHAPPTMFFNEMMKMLCTNKLTHVGEFLDTCNHKHDLKRPVWAWQGCGFTKK